jgi:hypothetical protein
MLGTWHEHSGAKLVLTDEEKKHLDQLRQSQSAAFRDVPRAP